MMIRDMIAWGGAALLLFAASCGEPEFRVGGEIKGAEGKYVVLEKSDFSGRWMAVDSVKVGGKGDFSLEASAPASPEIYRLSLDGRFLYFPVVSDDRIEVKSEADNFGVAFTLTGSPDAERLGEFDRALHEASRLPADSMEPFKRRVFTEYIKDGKGSIVSYYILTKTIGGKPLYDVENPHDARYFAAVATQFAEYAPEDPHTDMLRRVSEDALRRKNAGNGRRRVMEAGELSLIDIALPNEKGDTARLSEMAGKGRKVLLVFSMMNSEVSPAFNIALAKVREERGVDVYHVSFDSDVYAWRKAAANLPWTTVADPDASGSTVLRDYNVAELPVFFIIDEKGNLVDRASNFEELKKKI